jgi:CheY-like chemotaxis protein
VFIYTKQNTPHLFSPPHENKSKFAMGRSDKAGRHIDLKITGCRSQAAGFFKELKLLVILFIAKDYSRFSALVTRLGQQQDIQLVPALTGTAGLAFLKDSTVDLAIVDEQLDDMSGIALVKQLVKINPLVNTAIISTLSAEDFHEETEGLGVLMQLPPQPLAKDAEALLAVLEKIGGLIRQQPPQAAS